MGKRGDRQNKAVIAFRQSLKLNSKNGEGWNSLGPTYQTFSNYDEAFRCYKQAEALGNTYARQNYDNLKAALAVAAACNQGDRGAMDRYQSHQQTQEDKRKYGVQ